MVIRKHVERLLDRVRVALPGRIVSYDATRQSASIQLLIKHGELDEGGRRVARSLPICVDVPIMFPGSGDYRVTWPIAEGDTVLVHFCSSAITRWLARGGEVDPGIDRRHNISDAVAYPGLHDFAHVPTTAPTDAMVLHAAAIKLGSPGATDIIMRKSDAQAFMTALQAAIDTGAGSPQGLAALTALQTALANWLAGIDSSVKAD